MGKNKIRNGLIGILLSVIAGCESAPVKVTNVGMLSNYQETGVYQQYKRSQGFYIVHLPDKKIVALDVKSTHLGCITNWLPNEREFENPCQPSAHYNMQGVNISGPDPRPLERYKIFLDNQDVIVDKTKTFRSELGQWTSPESYIELVNQ